MLISVRLMSAWAMTGADSVARIPTVRCAGTRLLLLDGGHMLPVTQADAVPALIAQPSQRTLAAAAPVAGESR